MARSAGTSAGAAKADVPMKVQPVILPGDWLALVLEHHAQIRSAFTRAIQAPADGSRLAAFKGLAVLLNGHSQAEEVVLYPVLAEANARGSEKVYDEQAMAKIEMAGLELLDPRSDAWLEKVEEIRAAVEEHMQEEETRWFPAIKASGANQAKLSARYKEEFDRYTRAGAIGTNAAWDAPPRDITA